MRRIVRVLLLPALIVPLAAAPAPESAPEGDPPAPAPAGSDLTEAPLGVVVAGPEEACGWEGRDGDPPLPVIVPVAPDRLADESWLSGALACREARFLEVIPRLIPPTEWQEAPEPGIALGPWLDDLQSFMRRNNGWVHAIEVAPGPPGETLRPASWAYLIERVSTLVRSFRGRCAVLAGPIDGRTGSRLDELPHDRIRPYIEGITLEEGFDLDAIAGRLDAPNGSLPFWVHAAPGEDPEDLIRRIRHAHERGARFVSIDARVPSAALGLAATLIRLLPARYVPDPSPPPFVIEVPEGGEVIAQWTDTLGPEKAAMVPGPAGGVSGPIRFRAGGGALRRVQAFDLASGVELGGRLEGPAEDPAVVLDGAAGPVLVRYLPGEGDRAEPETVGVTASVELTPAEIIARLRVVEEAQRRATRHYTARAVLSFHYRAEALNESIDVASVNRFYWAGGVGEYEELELYVNGALWRGEIPSLPFIQPEKVTDVPIEVSLDPSYGYRLAGRETIDGREHYVLDFDPVGAGEALYSGRVWIDAESFTRRRIHLVQHGLKAPITSNADTIEYGSPPGEPPDHWVALSGYRQMVFTILGRSVIVERRVEYSEFVLNAPDFTERRESAYASGNPIARDDERGFARMIRQPGGEMIRQTASLRNMAFFGAVSVGSPILSSPAAGLNFFDFDWQGTGTQLDIAWAGPFMNAAWTDPSVAGSRWELSTEARLIGVRETLKRTTDEERRRAEDLDILEQRFSLTVARPFTSHSKGEIQLSAEVQEFDGTDSTGVGMSLPGDAFTATGLARWRYYRRGTGLELWGSMSRRSGWEDWGYFPGTDPNGNPRPEGAQGSAEDDRYQRWGLVLTKSFYPGAIQRLGLGLSASAGSGLDRMSRMRVGDFQSVRVRGFNSSDLSFDRGAAADLNWRLTLPGTSLSFEVNIDGAVIENREDFLSTPEEAGDRTPSYREYLIGAGLGVSFQGPWATLMSVGGSRRIASSLDAGGNDVSLRVLMVKTFDEWPWSRRGTPGPGDDQIEKR